MPRIAKYNKEGEIIRAAAFRVHIAGTPELAERTGIPYTSLHKKLTKTPGALTLDELRALDKKIKFEQEEILNIVRGCM